MIDPVQACLREIADAWYPSVFRFRESYQGLFKGRGALHESRIFWITLMHPESVHKEFMEFTGENIQALTTNTLAYIKSAVEVVD